MNTTPSNTPQTDTRRPASQPAYLQPAVDVYETEAGYVLLADMPGVTAEGLEVHVDDGQLTLHGKPADPTQTPTHREYLLREYHRTFTLADALDSDRISARFQDGVLRLEVPKAAKSQARKIPIVTA